MCSFQMCKCADIGCTIRVMNGYGFVWIRMVMMGGQRGWNVENLLLKTGRKLPFPFLKFFPPRVILSASEEPHQTLTQKSILKKP